MTNSYSSPINNNKERIILVIGRTGGGKSSICNVLTKSNDFEESGYSVSQTKYYQSKTVEVDDLKLTVVDTIGIGDTDLDYKDVLYRIADACYTLRGGLHQVLFVTSNRFTNEEIYAYDLLRSVIFNNDICKFTTIVRSNSIFFNDVVQCQNNDKLMRQDPKIGPIVESCNKILYVNNPPTVYSESKQCREESRTKMMLHLRGCNELYKPKELDELVDRIKGYMTENEKLQDELSKMGTQINKGIAEMGELTVKFDKSQSEIQQLNIQNAEKQKRLEELMNSHNSEMQSRQKEIEDIRRQMREQEVQYRNNVASVTNTTEECVKQRVGLFGLLGHSIDQVIGGVNSVAKVVKKCNIM
eukprot:gene2842-3532_t